MRYFICLNTDSVKNEMTKIDILNILKLRQHIEYCENNVYVSVRLCVRLRVISFNDKFFV